MEIAEIKKLANFSQIEIKEEEIESLAMGLKDILKYIDQVKEAELLILDKDKYFLKNVIREDVVKNQREFQSKEILKNAPQTQDGFIKVKKIL